MPDAAEPTGGATVSSAGLVTFDFAGHVHAQGLDLDEAVDPNVPQDEDSVRWLDALGVSREEVYGYQDSAGEHVLHGGVAAGNVYAEAIGDENADPRYIVVVNTHALLFYPPTTLQAEGGSQFRLQQSFAGDPLTAVDIFDDGIGDARIAATALDVARRIIANDQTSDFLQLAVRAGARVNWVNDSIATNGVNSAIKNVTHGLVDALGNAIAPVFAIAICRNNNANVVCAVNLAGAGTAQVPVQVAHRDAAATFGAGTTQLISLLAIG